MLDRLLFFDALQSAFRKTKRPICYGRALPGRRKKRFVLNAKKLCMANAKRLPVTNAQKHCRPMAPLARGRDSMLACVPLVPIPQEGIAELTAFHLGHRYHLP